MRKWLTGILCVLALTLGLTVSADAAEIVDSGYCGANDDGKNVMWEIRPDNVLLLTGTGKMKSYTDPYSDEKYEPSPWNNYAITNVILSEGITSIGNYAFFDMRQLRSVVIPDGLTEIGAGAFMACETLGAIDLPESLLVIGEEAFQDCGELSSVTVPDTVLSLAPGAFGTCKKLTSVTVGTNIVRASTSVIGYQSPFSSSPIRSIKFTFTENGRKSIAADLFEHNDTIEEINIPKGIEQIEYRAFYACDALRSVILPEGMIEVKEGAFNSCGALEELTLPNSITSIESSAFYGCTSLTDVYYTGTEAQWRNIVIESGNESLKNATIHFSAPPGYNSSGYRAPATVSTSTGRSRAKAGMKEVQFDAGADLYKNGKTRTTMNITWNWELFGANAIGYSKDLATAAVILSGNAYNQNLVYDTLGDLGFSNITQANYGMHGIFIDQVGYSIASTTQKIDGVKTNVIAIICRGTGGTFFFSEEWQSNIQHMSAGFGLAALDVINGLDNYISNPALGLDTSLPTKYFVTGHSRGAAVANLVGKGLSDAGEKRDVFVYTFACPTTTIDPNRQNYSNIKNFINVRDAVPALPGWLNGMQSGYNRYGLECSFDKSDVGSFDSWLSQLTGGSVSSDVDSVLKEHCIAVYAAYVMGADLFGPAARYKTKVISVHCPVDVSVYDQYDRLLGTITNNNPGDELFANGVFAVIDGDEKYLYTPSGYELRLELTGTDTGTMTYSVEEIDAGTGETVSAQTFSGVALSDGKTMTSAVAGEAADTQLLVTENGAVSAMVDEAGGETDAVLLSFVTGLGSGVRDLAVAKGESVGALPEPVLEGYRFVGWCTGEDLTVPFDPAAAVAAPMTLYASYEEALPVYGLFTDVSYDGEALSATLGYDYNRTASGLCAALYQDGRMLDMQSVAVASGAKSAAVRFAAPNLYGAYTLKAFTLDAAGGFVPISTAAETSFFAD